MPKSVFLFLAISLVLLQLISLSDPTLDLALNVLSFTLILTLGIAHGSIDHLLFVDKRHSSKNQFILFYLLILSANFALWFILPKFALYLFLLVSAYHFGQSQLIEFNINQKVLSKAFYISWGSAIITALIAFNAEEINQLFMTHEGEQSFFPPILTDSPLICYSFSALFILMGTFLVFKKTIELEQFLLELVQLTIILVSFYLFPVLIGFSLYFIILHSFRVLIQEYRFLKRSRKTRGLMQFTQLLLPFTLISIGGLALTLGIIHLFEINISLPFLLLALTSSVTLPHVFVMDIFYARHH